MFLGCFSGVSRVFLGCFSGVSLVFLGFFKQTICRIFCWFQVFLSRANKVSTEPICVYIYSVFPVFFLGFWLGDLLASGSGSAPRVSSWAVWHSGFNLEWKMAFDGRRPLIEDRLRWTMTFDGRQPLMEDNLWWTTTFDGGQPLIEDTLWCKRTFDGRLSWKKDGL